jgi:iron complex outermembrane receptor protein
MRTSLLICLPLLMFAAAGAAQESDELFASGPEVQKESLPAQEQGTATPESAQPIGESAELLPTIPVPQQDASLAAEPRGGRATQLEEIIVTATKRAKSARDVPVSINAMSGENLEKMGARDIQDFIGQVPGILLQEGQFGDAGSRKITIRGVGPSEIDTYSGNQTVGQFIGDIPMTDPYSNFVTPDLDPFDLETVEVLKGPQGTYFGASALNGAIRYVPNKPEMSLWSARGFAEHQSVRYGGADQTYAAAFNVPLGDSVAFRVAGVLQNAPGLIDNLQRETEDADSRRKWSGRGALRWHPTERFDVTAMVLQQESHKDDLLDVDNADEQFTNNSHPWPSEITTGFQLASIDARYEFDDWGTLILQSSRQDKSVDSALDATLFTGPQGIENFRGYTRTRVEGDTHELRLVSPDDGNWSWITGVFLLDYTADVTQDAYLPGTALPITLPPFLGLAVGNLLPGLDIVDLLPGPRGLSYALIHTEPVAKETSFYGELARKFGDDWELTLGARVYRTEVGGAVDFSGPTSVLVNDVDISLRDKGVSPKVSLSWKPADGFMMYATVARGFQFGGINVATSLLPVQNPLTGPPVPPSFDSSTLWSREIGVRMDWLERTLRTDITLYDLDWRDAQFPETNDNLIVDTTYISNVGEVSSRGVEASIVWLTPLEGLSINLAGAYARALTASDYTAANGTVVPAGATVPNAPRWQAATTLAYSTNFGAWLSGATLSHTYSGRAFTTVTHDNEVYGFGSLALNLNVSRPDWRGAPALNLGVTNLTDVRGVVGRSSSSGTTGATGGETTSYIYTRPLAFTLRVTAEFN